MRRIRIFACLLIFCLSCQEKEQTSTPQKEAQTSKAPKKELPLNQSETLFVGNWSTVFRDTEGKVWATGQTDGNYLEFREDREYLLFKENIIIRQGKWSFDPKDKMLKLVSKVRERFYYVENLQKDTIDMIDQKHSYKLTYIPYQPIE